MKLKNKISGEIKEFSLFDGNVLQGGATLESLTEEWEDYKEPKEYWYLENDGDIDNFRWDGDDYDKRMMRIGNCFETKEEAEKAVEKLKAWKRLKDKGFKVDLWDYDGGNYHERIRTGRILFRVKDFEENDKDLDLIFGGEE